MKIIKTEQIKYIIAVVKIADSYTISIDSSYIAIINYALSISSLKALSASFNLDI